MKGVFVTGTDTSVGKTWVGEQLIKKLYEKKINVIPRKPIESGWSEQNINNTDAWILAKAANKTENLLNVCPNRFKAAISPDRAARNENVFLTLETLKQDCVSNIDSDSFLFVEGAGGFYSPLCTDALNADLMLALKLPVILVAEDKLGCINHVLLTIDALKRKKLLLLAVVLNRVSNNSDNKLMNNHADLTNLLDDPVIAVAYNTNNNEAFNDLSNLVIKNNASILSESHSEG